MRTVYFVDDEFWLLTELRSIINWNEYGFEICGFNTVPFVAENEILQLKPDLVICDIYMDGMNGFELAQKVMSKDPDITFCFLSAYDKFEYAVTALKLGAVDYLTKPLKVKDLISVLGKVSSKENAPSSSQLWQDVLNGKEYNRESLKELLKNYFKGIEHENKESYFLVLKGKMVDKISTKEIASDCYELFASEHCKLFLTFSKSSDKLKLLSYNYECAIGVSPKLSQTNYANALKIAVTNANGAFVYGTNRVVFYEEKDKSAEFCLKVKGCSNKYELRVVVSTLKDYALKNKITAYELTLAVNEITNKAMALGVIFGDEISNKKPLYTQFKDFEQLCNKLNEIIDKACNKTANSIINSIMMDIQLNFAQVQSLEIYAKKYGYNASYLSWLFKKEAKKSFIEYVIECRMEKAKELLLTTKDSISEIGYRVGYNDYYHFTKAFKQNVGFSPTEYREIYGKYE